MNRDIQTLFTVILLFIVGAVAAATLNSIWVTSSLVMMSIAWAVRLYVDFRHRK